MFHPEIDKLILLRSNATPGVWGPTTAPPADKPEGWAGVEHYHYKNGERGEPKWGAVVSDSDPRPDIDHDRYATDWWGYSYERGTDMYGGTMICESLRDGNGEYIAALHNKLPGMIETIRNLRAMLLEVGLSPILLDQIIAESMEGKDPS